MNLFVTFLVLLKFRVSDWQLADLKRFCASNEFGVNIMGTFDCGDFDLTVITFTHPLLVSKHTGKHPTILGPMFVHRDKKVSTYLSIFQHLLEIAVNCLILLLMEQMVSKDYLRPLACNSGMLHTCFVSSIFVVILLTS